MSGVIDAVEPEDILVREGMEYRETSGGSGLQFNIQECPSCGDDRWKVYMNVETGMGNCFKCGTNFNKFTFTAAALQTEDKRAVMAYLSDLAADAGYKPKRERVAHEPPRSLNSGLPSSMPLPTTDGRNAQYLEERGINSDVAKYFGLRYCFSGGHRYVKDGEECYQKFDNRILIPVNDLDGKLATFQGRDVTEKSDRKYLFPTGLPGTGRYLLNGHNALATRTREVIVNEGFFDVAATKIAIDQHDEMIGIVPVGTFGKQLSFQGQGDTQLDAFRRLKQEGGLERVTIMWDGEREALSSALQAARQLHGLSLSVSLALLPAGRDPNEVPASVVYEAWKNATRFTTLLETRWLLNNPYD